MKTIAALVIALVTVVPHSANASPVGKITNGTFTIGEEDDSELDFYGAGFTVWAGREPGWFGPLSQWFGVEPIVLGLTLASSDAGLSFVTVGNWFCEENLEDGSCGEIRFTSPGFALPADWPRTTPFVETVPFTLRGVLCHKDEAPGYPCIVGEPRLDIVGSGKVTGTLCLYVPLEQCGLLIEEGWYDSARVAYTFTVDDPPTPLWTLASVITVGLECDTAGRR